MSIKRPVKMLLYAQPGTGKSVFAGKFPKPFFICTDGNYEWLLDFGVDPKAHVDISSYAEFEKIVLMSNFAGYDTIVIDLLEDIYKWNEAEYCKKMKVDHLSDAGGYGKGWEITRGRLWNVMTKLISLPKNILILSHESSYVTKDRLGNETTNYTASNLMSDKFVNQLEGRLRYFLRAYFKDEVLPDGKVITHRILSLIPKSNEYGIIRGVDVNLMPSDIELNAHLFLETVGYDFNDHGDGTTETAQIPPSTVANPVTVKSGQVVAEAVPEQVAPATDHATADVKDNALSKLADIIKKKKEAAAKDAVNAPEESQDDAKAHSANAKDQAEANDNPDVDPEAAAEEAQEQAIAADAVNADKQSVEVVHETTEPSTKAPDPMPVDQAAKLAAVRAKLLKLKGAN